MTATGSAGSAPSLTEQDVTNRVTDMMMDNFIKDQWKKAIPETKSFDDED